MRITCILNQKGGVGKTTTAAALAGGLTRRGMQVLAIDADPQCNLTYCTGAEASDGPTLYNVMKGTCTTNQAIIKTEQADVIPGDLMLSAADVEFTQQGREYRLREAIESAKGCPYDHIVIDCPPALGIMTLNALTAANDVVVPVGADIFSLQGLEQLMQTIAMVRKYSNPELKIAGLLITRRTARSIAARELTEAMQAKAGALSLHVYSQPIREAVAIREAQLMQKSIFDYAPKATITSDYAAFIDEYLNQEA